jgi:predicted regulator of Ras-like GTPase activity (Roadblock/LC7/MglB family)
VESSYLQAIRALREVPKVRGSFVLAEDGVLLASDLPDVQRETVLQMVGTKLLVLGESMDAVGDVCTGVELEFPDHTLFGCRVGGKLLAVLSEADVPAVRLQAAVAEVMAKLATLSR